MRPSMFMILAAGLALAASGCGEGTSTVTGSVKYKGTPVTAGTVTIQVAGKRPATGPIFSDGTYRVENAPVGDAKIAVQTPKSQNLVVNKDAPPLGTSPVKIVPVPERFADPEQSNLTAPIKSGAYTHDIDITE